MHHDMTPAKHEVCQTLFEHAVDSINGEASAWAEATGAPELSLCLETLLFSLVRPVTKSLKMPWSKTVLDAHTDCSKADLKLIFHGGAVKL